MGSTPRRHERRHFGRRQTALHGWIKVAGRPPLACMVRDMSVNGALIELVAPSWLPYQFKLAVDSAKFEEACEIKHQRFGVIGVQFLFDAAGRSVEPVSSTSADSVQPWANQRPRAD